MDENPYKSPQTEVRPSMSRADRIGTAWALALLAFVVGLPVGWFAVITGAHGGSAWPTVVFCAPVYLLATLVGDNLAYVAAMVLGTGALFGLYSYILVMQPARKGWLIVLSIHGIAILLMIPLWLM